jgi:hypothetical protein
MSLRPQNLHETIGCAFLMLVGLFLGLWLLGKILG